MFLLRQCEQSRIWKDYTRVKHTFMRSCYKHACTAISFETGGLNYGLSLDQCSYIVSVSSQGSGEAAGMLNTYL